MNCFDTRAVRRDGSWFGEYRAAEHGRFRTVQKDGADMHFPTPEEASAAAKDALIEHMNGTYRRDGEKLSAARSAAEKLFRKQKRRTAHA